MRSSYDLVRIDQQTALNLDAIASIRFAGDADEFSATVNFLSVPVTDTQGASFVSETFGGEAARNLLNLLGAAPKQSTGPEDDRPSYDDQPIPSPFVIGVGRKKAWYYHRGADGRCYFLAFVNAKGSCSMRTFDARPADFLARSIPKEAARTRTSSQASSRTRKNFGLVLKQTGGGTAETDFRNLRWTT